MEKILEKYKELQFRNIGEAYHHSCQLLTIDEKPKSHGTGVFIEVDDCKFLVTAAHVIDKKEKNLFIPIGGDNLISPGGDLTFTAIEQDREKDSIDIAVFKLSPETIDKLPTNYKFLSKNQLGINHDFKILPLYSVVGFPSSKSGIKNDQFKSDPFFYTTVPFKPENYNKLNRNINSNVIINYDKKNVYSMINKSFYTGPDLYGLSGCGLWYSDPEDLFTAGNSKMLVAILTDWPVKNRKCMIGTRIDVVTEILRKKFNLDLPKSKIVNIPNFK